MLAAIFIRGIEIGITTVPARAVFVLFINSKSYLFCSPFSTNAKTILPFLATFRRRSRGSRCWRGAFSTESSTGSYAKPAACCRSWKSATTRWTRSLTGCLDGEVIMKALRRRIGTKYHREHENTVNPRYSAFQGTSQNYALFRGFRYCQYRNNCENTSFDQNLYALLAGLCKKQLRYNVVSLYLNHILCHSEPNEMTTE